MSIHPSVCLFVCTISMALATPRLWVRFPIYLAILCKSLEIKASAKYMNICQYTLPVQNKLSWTNFSFDYGTHTLWHPTFIPVQSCVNFSPRSCIDDAKVFSSTSQRCSMGLRSYSGLRGGQCMCENDVSCSLNHSFTIWARWILALSSWNMSVSSGKKISIAGITWSFSIFR